MSNRQWPTTRRRITNPFLIGPTYYGLMTVLNVSDRNPISSPSQRTSLVDVWSKRPPSDFTLSE
jgi:hypothetical protein